MILKVEKKNNDYVIKGLEKYISKDLTEFDLEVSDIKIILENRSKYKELFEFEVYERYLEKKHREKDLKMDSEKLKRFQKRHNIHLKSIGEILKS